MTNFVHQFYNWIACNAADSAGNSRHVSFELFSVKEIETPMHIHYTYMHSHFAYIERVFRQFHSNTKRRKKKLKWFFNGFWFGRIFWTELIFTNMAGIFVFFYLSRMWSVQRNVESPTKISLPERNANWLFEIGAESLPWKSHRLFRNGHVRLVSVLKRVIKYQNNTFFSMQFSFTSISFWYDRYYVSFANAMKQMNKSRCVQLQM